MKRAVLQISTDLVLHTLGIQTCMETKKRNTVVAKVMQGLDNLLPRLFFFFFEKKL